MGGGGAPGPNKKNTCAGCWRISQRKCKFPEGPGGGRRPFVVQRRMAPERPEMPQQQAQLISAFQRSATFPAPFLAQQRSKLRFFQRLARPDAFIFPRPARIERPELAFLSLPCVFIFVAKCDVNGHAAFRPGPAHSAGHAPRDAKRETRENLYSLA